MVLLILPSLVTVAVGHGGLIIIIATTEVGGNLALAVEVGRDGLFTSGILGSDL